MKRRTSAADNRRRRRRHVHFNQIVVVRSAPDYDRSSPWMRAAADRLRFQRRIEHLRSVIDPILCDEHRLRICLNRMTL